MRRVLAAALLLLLTGCGLPLGDGVQVPKQVTAGQQQRGDIQVLPPGPKDDNTPEQVVRGFFGAQSNPDDRHASARAFLTPERAKVWNDAGVVSVFDNAPTIAAIGNRLDLFSVSGLRVGLINVDGSYTRGSEPVSVTVRLARNGRGPWQLADVPDGLFLSGADRDRSFRWRSVYFLARPRSAVSQPHVVPDPLYIPVTADPAHALVERLLAGPSTTLGDSAETAVPPGTKLLRPVTTDGSGVVTVDLSREVAEASAKQKERLSAQLVWTLRGEDAAFSALRLLSEGEEVNVPAATDRDGLQTRDDWTSYDPDGLSSDARAFYIAGRRLRSLDDALTVGPLSDESNRQLIDVGAAATRGGLLAVLTRERRGWVLRTGPLSGPFQEKAVARSISSPSWGSGEDGVWFLADGRVETAPGSGPPVGVPVDGIDRFGTIRDLRVSRDGARVALVAGPPDDGRLVVGRAVRVNGHLRVVGLRAIAAGVVGVRDVVWESATSLVVLGRLSVVDSPLPIRVTVDGSQVAPVIRVGLENSEPLSIASAPGRQLVVAVSRRRELTLLRDTGRVYTRQAVGYGPFYPG